MIDLVRLQQLVSRVAGNSGAALVGISPINRLPGAATAQEAFEQLANRSTGPATAQTAGTLKASRAPTDPDAPVALIGEEVGAAGGVAAQDDFAAHLSDLTDAHDAANVSYAGSAGLQSVDVEAALDELDGEKAPFVHRHPNATTAADGYQSKEDKLKLDEIAPGGGTPDATVVVKGRARASVAPAVAADPVFVGDNDPRVRPADSAVTVTRTTALSVPNNAWTPVSFDGIDEDPKGWRTSATVYTVGQTGRYLATIDGQWATDSNGPRVSRFSVNSGARFRGSDRRVASGISEFDNTTQLRLSAGETVTAEVLQASGGPLNLTAGVRLVLTRVG